MHTIPENEASILDLIAMGEINPLIAPILSMKRDGASASEAGKQRGRGEDRSSTWG
jgi:hypothetical protein